MLKYDVICKRLHRYVLALDSGYPTFTFTPKYNSTWKVGLYVLFMTIWSTLYRFLHNGIMQLAFIDKSTLIKACVNVLKCNIIAYILNTSVQSAVGKVKGG